MEDNDAQSQLKKVARRRLVGAVVFASVVAVVLPMVMDHEPRQAVQEVEIRIPGQDEKPFAPKFAVTPVEKPAARPSEDRVEEKAAGKSPEKIPEQVPEKSEKPAAKAEKSPEKAAEKPAGKETPADAKRAAALLAGRSASDAGPAKSGEFVILIGAFASEANVRNLRTKLGENGVKTYVEPLDTPAGKKTRVRAGPYASREAAEKALEKMKQAGVSGVISGK